MALPQLIIEAALNGQRGPAYKEAVLADFPLGYTRLDAQPPTDISGNGLSMGADAAPNRPTLTTGLLDNDTNQASAFNGSQRCQWNDNALLRPIAAITMEAWVKPTGVTGVQHIIRKDGCYALRLNNTGLDILLWDSGGTVHTINVASVFSAGNVYHIAAVYDGQTVTPYINGVAQTTTSLAITLQAATTIVGIGGYFNGTSWSEQFTGTIDEIAIYGTALWPTEVEYHYEARLATPPDQWTYTDITAYARSVTTRRGRSNVQEHADVGQIDVLLKNGDRRFEPGYAGLIGNYLANPTFGVDLTGWGGNASATVTRVTSPVGPGAASAKIVTPGVAVGTEGLESTTGGRVAAAAGDVWTLSAYARGNSGGEHVRVDLLEFDSGGTFLRGTTGANATLTSAGFSRLSVTATLGANTASVGVLIATWTAAAYTFYVNAVQLEKAAAATTYCDGDQDNCRWAGTPHESQSYRGGPYYPNIRTGIPIRVRAHDAVFRGDTYADLAHGFIDSITEHWNEFGSYSEVEILASDAISVLATGTVYTFAAPQESTSDRIKRTIQAGGLPINNWTVLGSATDEYNIAATTVDGSPLDHIHTAEDTEGGFLVAGEAFGDWYWMPNNYFLAGTTKTVGAIFGDEPGTDHSGTTELKTYVPQPYVDNERIHNLVQVTRDGGIAMTAADAASRRKDGLRSKQVSTLNLTDNDSLAMAQTLLARPGNLAPDPLRRYDQVQTRLVGFGGAVNTEIVTNIAFAVIGEQIRIIRRPPGTDMTDTTETPAGGISSLHLIQGIQWKIDSTANVWYVTFSLMPTSA